MHINDLEVGQYYMFVFKFVENDDIPVRLNAIHGQNDVEISLLSLESVDIEHSIAANPRSLRELTSDEYITHIIKPAARNFGSKVYAFLDQIWKTVQGAVTILWESLVTFVTLVRCNIWDKHEIDWLEHYYLNDYDNKYYRAGYCKHCGKRVKQAKEDHDERLR